MNEDLRQHISETCDGAAWKPVTGPVWENGQPWQLFVFDHDIEFEEKAYRCIIVERCYFDPDDLSAVDYAEDILAAAIEL